MQVGSIFFDQAVLNVELPKADEEVIPGVPWGAIEAFPTPAYWAYQVYARRLACNRINYKPSQLFSKYADYNALTDCNINATYVVYSESDCEN
mgnify:CR=1 FL=1